MAALKNAKRERFCLEYVKDLNGARAARAAGYTKNRSEQAAYELLTFPDVAGRVEELKAEAWKKLHMGKDELLARMAAVARFDPRKLFDELGNMKPAHEWDDETAWAVSGVDVEELKTVARKDDEDEVRAELQQIRKIRSSDRLKAQEMLGRYHGTFEEDNKQQGAASAKLVELLAEATKQSGGVSGLISKR